MRFFKKTILLFLITLVIFSTFAKKSYALFGVGDVVFDPSLYAAVTYQNAIQQSLQVKEFTLDAIATGLAKMVIRELTTSVVNWINSGFDGNPGFISNPSEFFKDVGDQMLGDFIQNVGPLNFLCSPFSIDIRLALAFKYRPFQKRISCTLTDVIKNGTGALENASINGFTAGDFSQGGWPAFVSMTTEPQNNMYGAYVQADYELSARIANEQKLKSDELNQGRGFLSWKKCPPPSTDPNFVGPPAPCEVQTPGSVIAGSIDSNLAGPLHELQLADEINEVVNALFAQLVKQVLTAGLRSVSGKGASDPEAYINQIQKEQTNSNQQLNSIKDGILKDIDSYINRELEYKEAKDRTLNLFIETKNLLDSAKTCFIAKLNDPNRVSPLTNAQVNDAQNAIAVIEIKIQTSITPKSGTIFSQATNVDQLISSLKQIKQTTLSAKNVNEISSAAQQYSSIISSSQLHTDKDILDAKNEQSDTVKELEALKIEAQRYVQACSLFPQTR